MTIEKAINQKKFANGFEKLAVNIIYTQSYLAGMVFKDLKPYDLSAEQYNVLRILRGEHPNAISTAAITSRMINRMSNASRLVEKLRKKELVERKICTTDKRLVDILITRKGLKLLKKIDENEQILKNYFPHLSVEEVDILNKLLDKLRKPNE